MSAEIFAICGLGNPGKKYAKTRHNAGFDVINVLADRAGVPVGSGRSWQTKDGCQFVKTSLENQAVVLLMPQTFMNCSGEAVQPLMNFFKIPVEQLVVIHDELDLDPGVLRLKMGGGTGGHNGLESIAEHLSNRNFYRVRVGIGHPRKVGRTGEDAVSDWVLSRPSREDAELIERGVVAAADATVSLITEGLQAAQQRFHTANQTTP